MLWIAPLLKICSFRFYAEGIKLSCTTCLVEALTTQCGIVIKVIISTLSTTLSCSSILIHILYSWFILNLHQENSKWTIRPETLNLARPSLSVWQVHKSLTWGDFISPSPRLGIEQSASRMEPHYYSRGDKSTHLWPNQNSFSKVPGNISRPLTLLRAKLCGKSCEFCVLLFWVR